MKKIAFTHADDLVPINDSMPELPPGHEIVIGICDHP